MEELLTVTGVCDFLKVSKKTVYNYINLGMPYIKLRNGRKAFKKEEVEKWFLGN